MNTFKYYVSIFLLSMICLIIGGLVYSQHSIAKNPSQQEEKAAAVNTEILSYESPNFKYKQIDTNETPPANFQTPNFDDSTWSVGNAAFGGGGGGCLSETVRTNWSVNSRLLVRKVVNVPANSTNLKIYIATDNDIEGVFVNGTQVDGNHLGNCAERNSAVYQVPDNLLQREETLIVYQLYDNSAKGYFDTRITADVADEMPTQQQSLDNLPLQHTPATAVSQNVNTDLGSMQIGSLPPTLFSQPHGEGLRGLSPATNAATTYIRWQKTLPRGIGHGGITFSNNGEFLYFKTSGGTHQGKVYKVRASDGVTVWETNPSVIGFGNSSYSGVTVDEAAGRLYTSGRADSQPSNGSIVAALNIADGSVIWVRKVADLNTAIGDVGRGIMLLSPDKTRLYTRDDRNPTNIIALEVATGNLIWRYNLVGFASGLIYQTVGPVWTDPTSNKTRIAFVNNSTVGSVGALQDDGATASLAWSRNVASGLNYHWWGNGATNLDDTRLYVPSFTDAGNPALTTLNTQTGATVWQIFRTQTNGINQYQNCLIGADGTIYSPGRTSTGGGLTAIRPDGTIKWQFVPPGSLELNSWSVVNSSGVIYAGDQGAQKLYAIKDNETSASLLWQMQFSTGNGFVQLSPSVGADGTLYIAPDNESTASQILYAFDPPRPDLQVTTSNAPPTVETDMVFNLSWTDENAGEVRADGTWTDKVYLSSDDQLGGDTLLANFPFTGSLDPHQTTERIQSINIPRSAISQNGDYFLIIRTDADNNVNEGANENNNFVAKPITVRKPPLPDLTIQSITAPDTAFFEQTIRIQWTVKNIGNGPTNAAEWQDWYYISSDNLPEIEDPFKAPLQNVSYLAAGESYTASADIKIPQGLVGSYKILVYTDFDGTNHRGGTFSIKESDELNNFTIARPIQINAPPLPDLQTTLVQAQEEAFTGQPFNLNWRVENRGDGTTPPSLTAWNDKIYLSQNTTFEPTIDRLIGSRPHDGKLLVTEGYSVNSFSVTLPADIAGNWYVFVVTDGNNQIFEFGNENNNSNYDRVQPGSPMLMRATPPDFIIPNAIGAPTNGTAAGQIAVSWTVKNQGAFDGAPNWFDTVYLSSDQTLNPADDIPLGTVARGNPLGAGLTYNAAANVTLPSCISGNYYLYVYADSRKQIFEYDPNFDAEANNYSQAKPITITSSPGDLRVTAVSNSVSGVAGQPTVISWTVANQGTGTTLNTIWNDEVYLSPTANFVKTNSTSIGAFTHTGALLVGESYMQTQNIAIPNTTQGNYYVFVLTDANNNVEECGTANDNNVGGSSTILNISNSLPDLTVSNFAFANSLFGGQGVNVTWTVTNSGNAAAQNSSWGDSVYFSTNATLDENDRILADVITNGPLNVGASYTKSAALTLPIVSPGSYYLILKTDNGNFVFEGLGENNNTRNLAFPITAPPVDLQVTAVNAPATANSGQTMTVNWTVANNGTDQTIGSQWADAVVLSLDQIDDPTDRVIGYAQHEGILNGGASYNATTDVFVPSGLAGQYYIFIRADRNNQLAESSETNNSSSPKPVSLQLAPPSDLIVTNVTQPATASPGESATFNWTVQNTGANPATGLWTDTVYLSTDQTWDIGDVLVGRYTAGVNVAPGQTYNGTLSTALPAVNLGNYYVIIRTDIRNRVIETNENNNTGASSGTTTVDVPELQLGVPQSTTLITGQERFYKFNAPADETVRVSLDGQDGSSNELYTRFGQMASRNAYDFLFDRLYEPDQQILIPNSNAGTYYNMIRGENVPNSLANNEVKQAGKLNIKSIDSKQAAFTENVTVKAEIVPFSITSISPKKGGSNGQVTLNIEGAKFDYYTRLELIKNDTILRPTRIQLVNDHQLFATFNLVNSPIGKYNVHIHSEKTVLDVNETDSSVFAQQVILGDQILTDGFEVSSNTGALNASLILPATARKDRVFSFLLQVSNNGDTDIPAPIYRVVSPSQTAISVDSALINSSIEKTVVLVGKATPTFLSPSEKTTIQFYAKAAKFPSSDFTLQNLSDSDEVVNWDSLESYYRETSDNTEWEKTWANFKSIVGTTRQSFHSALRILAAEKALKTDKTFIFADELIGDLLARAKHGQTISNVSTISSLTKTNNEEYDRVFSNNSNLTSGTKIKPLNAFSTPAPPHFCSALASKEKEIALDQSMRAFPLAIPSLYLFFGSETGQLWTSYVDYGDYNLGEPRSGRVEKYFGEGSQIVEGRTIYVNGFRNSRVTIAKDEKIRNAVEKALKTRVGEIPYNREYSISLNDLIAEEIKEAKLTGIGGDLNYGFPDEIPGNIAGGGDTAQNPSDRRIISGLATVIKTKNKCDKDVLEVNIKVTYQIKDTIDFCPGDPGGYYEQFLTIPFSRLETNEPNHEAYDVGINVAFQKELEPLTLSADNNNSSSNECRNPPPPNCCGSGGGSVETQLPSDPNEKIAPLGYGQQKYLGVKQEIPYTINFENVPTATASAQRVRVTDQLDPNDDPRTFRLKEIGFGSYRLQVPENRAFFQQRVQLGAEFNNILADISAGVDISTGKVTWTLTAIDPATGEQPNSANLGLLAPNDETGRGQGFVTYTVQPKQTAPTGTVIRNNATIIFDTEEPITTNTVTNTLDADIPTSAVNALPPTQANTTFTVSWAGQDAANGSGLQNYDIWVAENDGAYQPFVSGTTETSAAFTGTAGKTYKFYSIARDNAGNVEAAPAVPDATTMTLTSQSYEGDVLSRPNGDGFVDSDDVQQIRRFSLGLDTAVTGGEFQRADCSPRSSLGEGYIDSGDIQQARRYSVGIDAGQFAGGPSTPSPIAPPVSDAAVKGKLVVPTKNGAAAFRADNQNTSAGSTLVVPIRVDAIGNEAGYTFSIAYDSTKLTNPQVAIGNGGGDVVFNANNAGQIGFSVTSFRGGTIAAGNNIALVNVTFTVAATAEAGTTPISFTDTITKRMASPTDPNNPITQPTYTAGTITIGEAMTAGASISGRVVTANGRGIGNAIVTLTDANGSTRTAITTTFGYYRFADVSTEQTYTISAAAKRYKFGRSSLVLNLTADSNEVNFVAVE